MKTFKIQDIINGEENSIILVGNVQNGNRIEPSTFICFESIDGDINIRIIQADTHKNYMTLEISKKDYEMVKHLKLKGSTNPIRIANRGIDISMAASYGVGVSWWAPFVLIFLGGLIFWDYSVLTS